MTSPITNTVRQEVQARAGGRCEYCRTSEQLTGYALEVDHIIPLANGGDSTTSNLCLACRRCNAYKSKHTYSADPQTGQDAPLFNPRLQIWAEHFAWSDDGCRIVGLTPIGRATVEALRLNDPLIVRARALWVTVGWHPPTD